MTFPLQRDVYRSSLGLIIDFSAFNHLCFQCYLLKHLFFFVFPKCHFDHVFHWLKTPQDCIDCRINGRMIRSMKQGLCLKKLHAASSSARTLTSHIWCTNQEEPRKRIGQDYRVLCLLAPGILWMNHIFWNHFYFLCPNSLFRMYQEKPCLPHCKVDTF